MARKLGLDRLRKIDLDEKLDLICDILIPAVYLKASRRGNGELRRINFYKKLAREAILNSNLSREEKFYLIEDLKSFFNFLLEEDQIGGYLNSRRKKKT
jgi:hypothetical protein